MDFNKVIFIGALIASGIFSFTATKIQTRDSIVYAIFSEYTYSYSNQLAIEQAQEIIDLNVHLNKIAPMFQGSLEGKQRYFYEKCNEFGIPFDLALAITLHESAYGTSYLAMEQYNYGGLRGGPNGWAAFNSAEEGIDYYLSVLKNGYFDLGATTPEAIQPFYCPGSTSWVPQIYDYMNKINEAMHG